MNERGIRGLHFVYVAVEEKEKVHALLGLRDVNALAHVAIAQSLLEHAV